MKYAIESISATYNNSGFAEITTTGQIPMSNLSGIYRTSTLQDPFANQWFLTDTNFIKIKDVKFFNNKTTVVWWEDGSKTVVVCQDGDTFDKEKGLAMAITKRVYGDKGNYNNIFREWIYDKE